MEKIAIKNKDINVQNVIIDFKIRKEKHWKQQINIFLENRHMNKYLNKIILQQKVYKEK